jgi:hypothetical protein
VSQLGEFTRPGRRRTWQGWYEPRGTQTFLGSSSGTKAAEKGEDFASVIGRLPGNRLAFWRRRFKGQIHERAIIDREMERRRVSRNERDQDGQMLLFPEPDDVLCP